MSAVRNTVEKGKEQTSRNSDRTAFDAALREYCDKHYHQLLPIIAKKVHQEKVREVSQHSESRTPNVRGEHQRGRRSGRSRSVSVSPERASVFFRIRRDRSESLRHKPKGKGRRDEGVFNRVKRHHERKCSRRTEMLSESEDSGGGHWKSKSKKQRSSIEDDDLSQPWVCEEIDPFTSRIRYFDLSKKTHMPNNVKTYDESDDPEDHLKIFQAAAKVEQSIDSYDDLKKAFLANFLQQKKCINDPVEIHHIKQREWESTKDFVQRFKAESRHVKGALECMRISGFMHGITNPELIKRLHDNIPKSMDEMMRVTTTFLRGEVITSNQARKKTLLAWKQQDARRKQNFDRIGDFRNQQRSERRRDKFTDMCNGYSLKDKNKAKIDKTEHEIGRV
ncbi:reverse transcriptase domain-containing protein [Tanacetum coccineum]